MQIAYASTLILLHTIHKISNQKDSGNNDRTQCLKKFSKNILTYSGYETTRATIPKKIIKIIFPIFIECNSKPLIVIEHFITESFINKIYEVDISDPWISIQNKTLSYFYVQSFEIISFKLKEISQKFKPKQIILDEELIITLLNRINKLSIFMRGLLFYTQIYYSYDILLEKSIKYSIEWLEKLSSIFPILCEIRNFAKKQFDQFLNSCIEISSILHYNIEYIRTLTRKMQGQLPNLTKALVKWTYTLKNSLKYFHEEIELTIK